MPFTKQSSRITVISKNFGDSPTIAGNNITPLKCSPCSITNRITPSYNCRTRRGAHRAHMKVSHPDTFFIKPVKTRSFQIRIAVATEATNPLVVRQHQNDIRTFPSGHDRFNLCRQNSRKQTDKTSRIIDYFIYHNHIYLITQ